MQKHRKIFYFPGMISLLVLPLLCMLYFYQNRVFTEYQSMNIYLSKSGTFVKFENGKLIPIYPKRNYNTIYLTDNESLNEIKINEIRTKTKNLSKDNDSINGIKINFKKSNYQNFITVLDNLAIDNIPLYCLDDYEINVICNPPKKSETQLSKLKLMPTCGNYEANKDYFEKLERDKIYEQNIKYFKQKWQILLAYFGLVMLNIFTILKWRKIRIKN